MDKDIDKEFLNAENFIFLKKLCLLNIIYMYAVSSEGHEIMHSIKYQKKNLKTDKLLVSEYGIFNLI